MDGYDLWLEAVNSEVQQMTGGFGIYDLVDYDYRSLYEDGIEPSEAAEMIVENDGTYG
jgi:hypothetical protein